MILIDNLRQTIGFGIRGHDRQFELPAWADASGVRIDESTIVNGYALPVDSDPEGRYWSIAPAGTLPKGCKAITWARVES